MIQVRSFSMKQFLLSAAAALALTISATAATHDHSRTATFTSSAVTDSGKCTVEVMVPGQARVKINGSIATLERVSGRTPEWRRFECTSPMPKKPASFRVESLGGRGHQDLVHGPRHNGGTATVRIDDPKKGDDVYTFDVVWGRPTT
jgi:hypothetical protein